MTHPWWLGFEFDPIGFKGHTLKLINRYATSSAQVQTRPVLCLRDFIFPCRSPVAFGLPFRCPHRFPAAVFSESCATLGCVFCSAAPLVSTGGGSSVYPGRFFDWFHPGKQVCWFDLPFPESFPATSFRSASSSRQVIPMLVKLLSARAIARVAHRRSRCFATLELVLNGVASPMSE